MKIVLFALFAALATTLPARAAQLLFEASFTATLTDWKIWTDIDYAYKPETDEYVPFDIYDYSATELGILGSDIGGSWNGQVSVYEDESGYDTFITNYGRAWSGSIAPDGLGVSFQISDGVSFILSFSLGPEGGTYYYENDAWIDGTVDGLYWYTTSGLRFDVSLTDVRITTPSPVPLPPGGLLLGGALAVLALRRKGRPARIGA